MFTTAIFSVLMLGREIPLKRWFALVLLFLGICCVQLDISGALKTSPDVSTTKNSTTVNSEQNPFLGGTAVIAASVTRYLLHPSWLIEVDLPEFILKKYSRHLLCHSG